MIKYLHNTYMLITMSKHLYMIGTIYKNGKNSNYVRQIRKYKMSSPGQLAVRMNIK